MGTSRSVTSGVALVIVITFSRCQSYWLSLLGEGSISLSIPNKIILEDLKIKWDGPMKLYYDNKSAISIAHIFSRD